MLEKEFNTKIYYNEYAYLQLKESVLKKYRQEMMYGTEGIEDEVQRNAKIKENQTKIANWLSSEVSENKDFKYVLYGLDADLIFLALSTNSDKIYLLREANQMNNNDSSEALNYVSIKIMKAL